MPTNLSFRNSFIFGEILVSMLVLFYSIKGHWNNAAVLLLVAFAFRIADGKVKRRQQTFMHALRALTDLLSFGIAPAIFAFTYAKQQSWLGVLVLSFFVLAVAVHLARDWLREQQKYFEGMPPVLMNLVAALLFFLSIAAWYWQFVYLAAGILVLSKCRLRRFR